MSARTAVWLCCTALAVGLVGDHLLRGIPWGAGAALWVLLSIGVVLAFAAGRGKSDGAPLVALLLAAAFFGSCLVWRDAPELKAWNVLATVGALTLGLLRVRGVVLRITGVLDYVAQTVIAGLRLLVAPLSLVTVGITDRIASAPRGRRAVRAVVVGVVVAVPILVVFGALLASADPVFDRMAGLALDWIPEQLVSHLVVIAFLSWLAGGYLRSVAVADDDAMPLKLPIPRPASSALEIGIPLGALALLFLVFVVVQARYLFGDDVLIRSTVGLTYAEYARQGFFQLVVVAGLVLPLLLASEWAVDEGDRAAKTVFRGIAVAILGLVGLIIASAAVRLRLYTDAYGLTQDRLYAVAVMVWTAVALAWFGWTVLRDRRQHFAFGAIMAALAVVAGTNVLNPDALIARTNLARAHGDAELDARYLALLSADATPTLVAALPDLTPEDRCTVIRALVEDADERQSADWRSWSVARSGADRAVEGIEGFRTVVATECAVAPREQEIRSGTIAFRADPTRYTGSQWTPVIVRATSPDGLRQAELALSTADADRFLALVGNPPARAALVTADGDSVMTLHPGGAIDSLEFNEGGFALPMTRARTLDLLDAFRSMVGRARASG